MLTFPVLYLTALLVIVFYLWDPVHVNDYFAFRDDFTILELYVE